MFYLPAFILATTLTGSLNTADINNLSQYCEQIKKDNTIIVDENNTIDNLDNQLKKYGIDISNWNGCPVVTIKPGCNLIPPTGSDDSDMQIPDSTEAPEAPEETVPETEVTEPETEVSTEASTESTEEATTEAPETVVPEETAPTTVVPPTTVIPPTTEAPTTTPNASYVQQIVNLVNVERAKVGLPALKEQSNITASAQVRAVEIKQSFSHTRPNGKSFSTALTENGVSFRGAGENIAWGQRTPEAVMKAWMNSDGHRANILNKNFTSIGVGYFVDSNGTPHWAQLFTY